MAPEQRAVEVGWRALMCRRRGIKDSVSSSSSPPAFSLAFSYASASALATTMVVLSSLVCGEECGGGGKYSRRELSAEP